MRIEAPVGAVRPLPWVFVSWQPALWVAGGLLALYLAGLALYLATLIPYPYPIHFEEGIVLNGTFTLAQGGDLYKDNSSPPYMATVYAPLHYLIFLPMMLLAGPNIPALRLVSLLSTILLALLIYRWVSWRTDNRLAALFAAGILLTFFPVIHWAAVVKGDSTAVLFSVAGGYVVDRYARKPGLWWAVPLFALALFTKQTQLAAPLAAGLYLLLVSPRRALRFGAAFVAAVGVPFILLDLLTNHHLYVHTVGYNEAQLPWVWRGKQLFKSYIFTYSGYIVLAVASSLALFRRSLASFPAIYLVASFLGTGSVVAAGSDFNHFMENAAVLSLLAGIGLARALSSRLPWLPLGASLLLAAQLTMRVPSVASALPSPWLPVPDEAGRQAGNSEPPLWVTTPTPEGRETADHLISEIAAARGPVLVELCAFATLAGRAPVMDDPFMFSALNRTGKWSQSPMVSQLQQGKIALVALLIDVRPQDVHYSRLTDQMIDAIRNRYHLVETLPFPGLEGPQLYIYRPVDGPEPSRGEPWPG